MDYMIFEHKHLRCNTENINIHPHEEYVSNSGNKNNNKAFVGE